MGRNGPWFSNGERAGAVSRGKYVRMSTEHQQYSPENQLEIIRQYAAAHNMEIVQAYSDHAAAD